MKNQMMEKVADWVIYWVKRRMQLVVQQDQGFWVLQQVLHWEVD